MSEIADDIEFTEDEIQLMLDRLDSFTPEEQEELFKIADVLERRMQAQSCRDDLIEFCKRMQPDYKVGKHHRVLADMLMAIATGKKDRVCINMPPRHGKSQLVSIYFPAWFLGKYPDKKVLMVSHTADLAVDFGRKVRNLIALDAYKEIFPGVELAADSKSAGRWNTNSKGEYYACGVGSALAGRGADLLLVDDPHNEQDILNGNFEVFDKAYDWFAFGARTRLMPGGRVAVVQCMTGDTPVRMADGRERQLQDLRPGDAVATYDNGVLATSTVVNHGSNGVDSVYAIATTCNKTVRANERHPFLVNHGGTTQWVRLKDLRPGDCLVSLKDAQDFPSLSTCSFTTTKIASIEYCGEEEVFDVQIDRTENFIACGLVTHNTRWHMDDLSGRLIKDMHNNELADQYEVVEFPAIIEVQDRLTKEMKTRALWPEFFDIPALLRTKASMPVFQWNAQYQQNPTAEEASIVKREWWQIWEQDDPPPCEYIIMTLDTAAETHNRADFTALTTWGVFKHSETDEYAIILLNAMKDRVEFPELKELAHAQWKQWEPDAFIVEKKSSGTALYQELRRMQIPVQEYTPHRGSGDKLARLNSVADIVKSGLCWVPQRRWAEELVEEIAGFPFMSHDDLVDCSVMALMRFRQGGFIRLPTDEQDEIRYFKQRRGGYY